MIIETDSSYCEEQRREPSSVAERKILPVLEIFLERDVKMKWKTRNNLFKEGNKLPVDDLEYLESGLEMLTQWVIKPEFQIGTSLQKTLYVLLKNFFVQNIKYILMIKNSTWNKN